MRPEIRQLAPGESVLDDLDALVPPTFWHCPEYVETIGPEVADLNALFGYTPNPEQRILLDASFGMDHTGRLAAFEVFVLAARQNLKTGFFIQRGLGKALLLRRPLQIWTAHKESATDTAYATYAQMAEESAEFSKRVKAMPQGKGDKAVEFTNGCTIVFRPRTGKAGQSMSADDVDLDEYFAVEPKHEGSLIPTLSTRPNAQIGKASSAPHVTSRMQRTIMARGRAAAEGLIHEPRLVYAEWSGMRRDGLTLSGKPRYSPVPCLRSDCTHAVGSEGCIADNREVIKLANPSVGRSTAPSITWDYIESERRSLASPDAPPDAVAEWLKERLSIGVEDVEGSSTTIFGPASIWESARVDYAASGVGAIGIAQSADRQWISLVGASLVEQVDEEDETAEPVDVVLIAPILRTSNLADAIEVLRRVQDEHDCVAALDENGPGAVDLIEQLEDDDVAVEAFTLAKYAAACTKFHRRLKAEPQSLLHLSNASLDTALAAAEWKWVSDQQIIRRRDGDESLDTDMLEAAVIAAKAAEFGATFETTQIGVRT